MQFEGIVGCIDRVSFVGAIVYSEFSIPMAFL
jgi:hypothetical protein